MADPLGHSCLGIGQDSMERICAFAHAHVPVKATSVFESNTRVTTLRRSRERCDDGRELVMVLNVPDHWRVFVLDDTEERIDWFRRHLRNLRYAKTAQAAIELLSQEPFDLVFLDHDLSWMDAGFPDRLHGNGKEVARYLAYSKFPGKIVIHSHSDQSVAMARILPQALLCRFDCLEITMVELSSLPDRPRSRPAVAQ